MTFDRLLVIFAAIVAAVQGWKWVRDRRGEHGLKRMGESYADKDDVRAIRADLHRLKNERGELEVAVPALAARLHLEQRRRDLASTLGKAWDEYRDVDAKLNEDDPAAGLSPALVDILRTEIEPQYRAKVRGRRGTRLLLVIMAAALILPAPFTPRSLLYLLGNAVYIIAKLPQLMGHFALTAGVLMTCFGIVAGFIVGSWLKSTRILPIPKRPSHLVVVGIGIVVAAGNIWSFWITLTALNWGSEGIFSGTVTLNTVLCVLAAIGGFFLAFSGLRPWASLQPIIHKDRAKATNSESGGPAVSDPTEAVDR